MIELAPEFEAAARPVVFSRLDVAANDIPDEAIRARGVPTLLFVSAASGAVTLYTEAPDVAPLREFVRSAQAFQLSQAVADGKVSRPRAEVAADATSGQGLGEAEPDRSEL